MLSLPRAQVQFPVRELRSPKLRGVAKKKEKKKKKERKVLNHMNFSRDIATIM